MNRKYNYMNETQLTSYMSADIRSDDVGLRSLASFGATYFNVYQTSLWHNRLTVAAYWCLLELNILESKPFCLLLFFVHQSSWIWFSRCISRCTNFQDRNFRDLLMKSSLSGLARLNHSMNSLISARITDEDEFVNQLRSEQVDKRSELP